MYSNELICRILDYLDCNRNKKISIEEISSIFSYNRYYIMKLFKKEIGISIAVYLNRLRIYHSVFDIQKGNDSLMKVALCNGFYSLEYFSEVFHKMVGISPSKYQLYCKYRFIDSDKDLSILRSNLFQLQNFINFIAQYKKNKKPRGIPVLKHSIFK